MSAELRREAQARAVPSAWLLVLAIPLLGLALLLGRPELDITWEHHPSHFWLVLLTAGVSVALAFLTNEVADRRGDARLVLISLAFLASAGFLGLHALATPEVLLPSSNAGFVIATPVGLAVASAFAAASISRIAGPHGHAVLRHREALRAGLLALMVVWAIVSLARLPPLAGALPPSEAVGPVAVLAAAAVALYAASAWRYAELYRRRGSILALAIFAALVLLAEAALAVLVSRNWRLSWWEWHLLMAIAFASIALGARAEYRRLGSITAAFGGIYLEATLARVDRWHAFAIGELVAADQRGEPPDRLLADLRRDGASAEEIGLLRTAAVQVRELDELFRPYLPAELASRLPHEPSLAALGGGERVVSVVFADLAGFTTFSETTPPGSVIDMLNSYWAAVVPVIDAAGGVIEHFAGDGVMVIFNAVAPQPDHAARAARAALEIVRATDPLAAAHAGWPRFRVGVSTGPAVVGNIGTAGRRTFGAIGDTSNLGSRLMSVAQPGQVVIGRATWDDLANDDHRGAKTTSLGSIQVKGKREPVEAWILHRLAGSTEDVPAGRE